MNKNKIINVILVVGVCLVVVGFSMLGIKKYQEYKEAERIRNAIIKVELNDNLNINFNSDVYVMDLITSINGTIIDNYKIDTTKLGIKDVTFKFINEENIKVPYTFAPAHKAYQSAGALGALAQLYYQEGKIESASEHRPDYLRLSQAERELIEKTKSQKA